MKKPMLPVQPTTDAGHAFKCEMFEEDFKERLPHMSPEELEGFVKLMETINLRKKGYGLRMDLMLELASKLRKQGARSSVDLEARQK